MTPTCLTLAFFKPSRFPHLHPFLPSSTKALTNTSMASFNPPLSSASIASPMAYHSLRGISDTKLLQEIKALSETLYQSHSFRHPPAPRTPEKHTKEIVEKRGIWRWKPIRALSHIGMRRLGVVFSVEVVAVKGLMATLDGISLSVSVRKKETKEGGVQTRSVRVVQGCAEFDERIFVRCHVYCSGGGRKPLRFEPRPFVISVGAVDAPGMNFGRNSVDLSLLVRESLEKIVEGGRVREWDKVFVLSGKAMGGELMVKLGFQIVEDRGVGFYNQAMKQPKSSFGFTNHNTRVSESSSNDLSSAPAEVLRNEDPEKEVVPVDQRSVASEVVKEVVHDQALEAFESAMIDGENNPVTKAQKVNIGRLDDAEETVTKEFLQMLEFEDGKEAESGVLDIDGRVFLSDLGKGLGTLVQTRDGGYLASMNPLDEEISRDDTPKLAMQISRAFVLQDRANGFNLFQKLAALGSEELGNRLLTLAAMDELYDKTAGQIAIEGIASAIVSGRNKERADSSAARTIAAVKTMATALAEGRGERILTGVWNVREEPVLVDEILTVSLQKMEDLVVEALKIQADKSDEDATSTVPALEEPKSPLDAAVSLEDCTRTCGVEGNVTLLVIIQPRDPSRRNEAVGAPVIALVEAERVKDDPEDEEARFEVTSLHMGGLMLKSGAKSSVLDGEKQRLTATQWLAANGLGKAGKKDKPVQATNYDDSVWSISSRVVANMWLHPVRNPDVKFC